MKEVRWQLFALEKSPFKLKARLNTPFMTLDGRVVQSSMHYRVVGTV